MISSPLSILAQKLKHISTVNMLDFSIFNHCCFLFMSVNYLVHTFLPLRTILVSLQYSTIHAYKKKSSPAALFLLHFFSTLPTSDSFGNLPSNLNLSTKLLWPRLVYAQMLFFCSFYLIQITLNYVHS